MTKPATLSLCWLRADLRVNDNQALYHAAERGAAVAVFIATPSTWQAHDDAPIKVDFWRRNLAALRKDLQKLNIPLLLLHADSWSQCPKKLLDCAQKLGADALFFNDEYGVHEQARDDATQDTWQEAGLQCEPQNPV